MASRRGMITTSNDLSFPLAQKIGQFRQCKTVPCVLPFVLLSCSCDSQECSTPIAHYLHIPIAPPLRANPNASPCLPFFTIPEGCYALVTQHGADVDYEGSVSHVSTIRKQFVVVHGIYG